ncbi:synaptonemal complex protein 1 isoform X2 [Coffea arabica]|uniref:Synaptonemal complex protein 1 isoform X2 n=1 Tax=Coffea arabica TaxID=13443 RepID=A0ABM4VXL1_COFAR
MSKLLGLSSLKSFDHFKSLAGSASGGAKTLSISSRASSDSVSLGSFANLKLTAEKLVKEQASAKTDLDLANAKLKKLTEHIHILEEKLQNAFNENAKLKVKQKEDEKLWKGLESKFSSTKTLCDQLTETLQHLAAQVQDAEKDKVYFEDKLSASSVALDNLHEQMKSLSLRLESSEEAVRTREKELRDLHTEKESVENSLNSELKGVALLIEEKDAVIRNLEETVATNGLAMESLNSKLEKLDLDLKVKEDDLHSLNNSKEELEKEKDNLVSINKKLAGKLENALQEIKTLENFVNLLTLKLAELESQSVSFSEKVVQLTSLFESCFKLLQDEKHLAANHAQKKFDKLQDQSMSVTEEKNALQLVNQELSNKVIELQKEQEYAMVQHAEECRLAEETVRRLESELETLKSKKNEMEVLIAKLQDDIGTLSENSRTSDEKLQDFMLKISELEIENKRYIDELQSDITKKQDEIDLLRKEMENRDQHIDSLEKQVIQLNDTQKEIDRLVLELKDREKQLEEQKAKIEESLSDAETKLSEAKKQYDQMLESKQLELSRNLKEISQKNDQAINDIRRKYEVEKLESASIEKEKADKVIGEMERNCQLKLEEYKEESRQYLLRIQEEHAALISRIQQEHDKKELLLMSNHSEEIKQVQLQAEKELREKTTSMRNEHEIQLRALKCEHEDECRRLQEELDIQKSKEERQRALLQLQWKVMADNPQDDQEVNSKKNYSVSSTKMRNSENDKRGHHTAGRREVEQTDSPYLTATQTPVSNLLRKAEKGNTGNVMSLPKHSRKVTHHEYEVETANGRTITKKRKTKSTVMFAGTKGQVHTNSSNIGDLFSEGSLNPYADDPYAFD